MISRTHRPLRTSAAGCKVCASLRPSARLTLLQNSRRTARPSLSSTSLVPRPTCSTTARSPPTLPAFPFTTGFLRQNPHRRHHLHHLHPPCPISVPDLLPFPASNPIPPPRPRLSPLIPLPTLTSPPAAHPPSGAAKPLFRSLHAPPAPLPDPTQAPALTHPSLPGLAPILGLEAAGMPTAITVAIASRKKTSMPWMRNATNVSGV